MPTLSSIGLKENWRQFTLLVIVNAFVGGMVGMERSIFPDYALQVFGLSSKTAVLFFIIAFGTSKAIANYFAGKLANRWGRKNLLVVGWLVSLPVPIILIFAPSWNWVILANVLLGIGQGLTWSITVVMKIDLVGEKNRGLAMGINEFAGYVAVGGVALLTGYLAQQFGVNPVPFYAGIFMALCGLGLSLFWVKDTRHFLSHPSETLNQPQHHERVFAATTWKHPILSTVSQAGLVNNLNDGMIWGLLPMLVFSAGLSATQIGWVAGTYPAVWGFGQLFTGSLADKWSRKKMLFWGMFLQGMAILALPVYRDFSFWLILSAILGLGTALVYPTFLVTIAHHTSPIQRAETIGVFRLWRDLGYAIGAILSGITADVFGVPSAIILVGIITLLSALIIQLRMPPES